MFNKSNALSYITNPSKNQMSGLLAMRHKIKLCDNFSGVVFFSDTPFCQGYIVWTDKLHVFDENSITMVIRETDNFLYQIHKPYTYKKIIGTSEKIELTEKVLDEF